MFFSLVYDKQRHVPEAQPCFFPHLTPSRIFHGLTEFHVSSRNTPVAVVGVLM